MRCPLSISVKNDVHRIKTQSFFFFDNFFSQLKQKQQPQNRSVFQLETASITRKDRFDNKKWIFNFRWDKTLVFCYYPNFRLCPEHRKEMFLFEANRFEIKARLIAEWQILIPFMLYELFILIRAELKFIKFSLSK